MLGVARPQPAAGLNDAGIYEVGDTSNAGQLRRVGLESVGGNRPADLRELGTDAHASADTDDHDPAGQRRHGLPGADGHPHRGATLRDDHGHAFTPDHVQRRGVRRAEEVRAAAVRRGVRVATQILACVRRAPGLTPQQIAGRINHSENTCAAVLLRLYREGLVDRVPSDTGGAWCYCLSKTHPDVRA